MDHDKRKEILKKLVLSEEDTLEKFQGLIEKSRKLFAIDGKTYRIVFEAKNLSNPEKIVLFLIGKYFAKELGLIETCAFSSRELSDALGIKITTLTSPLTKLQTSGYIDQKSSKYFVNHYKIESILDALILKHQKTEVKITPGLSLGGGSATKSKKEKKTPKQSKPKKTKPKDTSKVIEIPEIKFSNNPQGISDLAKDVGCSEGKIKMLFEFEEKSLHLLKKKHYDNDSDENFHNSVIYLTAFYYHFDQREVSSRFLIKCLREANINTGAHFKRDMGRKERRSFILAKGNNYKITENGIKYGLKLIKEMIS